MTRRRLIISPRANSDLDNIWDYSFDNWGPQKADDYIFELRTICEALAAGTHTGRPCDNVRRGYFNAIVGSHLIFYKAEATKLDVKRILHQSMDFRQHL